MIETIHRATVQFDNGDLGEIENAVFEQIPNVEMFTGCPAAGPSFTVECSDYLTAQQAELTIRQIVLRHGGEVVA